MEVMEAKQEKEYYLETEPQAWSGLRQMHAAGCALIPANDQVKSIGRFAQSRQAMAAARRIYRRASSCYHCCKG